MNRIDPEKQIAKLREALQRELADLGEDLTALAVRYLDSKGVNDTGDLRKSITYEVQSELNQISLAFGTNIKYAIFVHEGTKPHWPPEKPIRQWVVRKLGIKGEAVPAVTFAVRRKISKVGTKPVPFLRVPFRAYREIMAKRIIERIEQSLKN